MDKRKVWHVSDVHLSFNDRGQIIKDMSKRKWSTGATWFDGYLDRIVEFSEKHIKPCDIVFITGDITHDMKEDLVPYSLRWLRENINGTIVICRGNHDKFWHPSSMKERVSDLEDFYIMEEEEILYLGDYTIGCYSNHSRGTEEKIAECTDITGFALKLVSATKNPNNTIMVSHYPLNRATAEAVSKLGVKAFLSGHVHVTDSKSPDCTNTYWYDQDVAHTDMCILNDCYFSSAAVDTVQLNEGQSFRHIEHMDRPLLNKKEFVSLRNRAQGFFKCKNSKLAQWFTREDPFNGNVVSGFICREKGRKGGSLFITHVNYKRVEPQLIYGTPKLEYPYKSLNSTEYKRFKPYKTAVIAEKWNGMNVLFYKYRDRAGQTFLSAKSKGMPFLKDVPEVGDFLSLTEKVLGSRDLNLCVPLNEKHRQTCELLSWLYFEGEGAQSISFELCGSLEPHLVKYDFDIALKPLFLIEDDGSIRPMASETAAHFSNDVDIAEICKEVQENDLKANEEYRKKHGLPHRYEYEHFAVEGKVLFLLDENGQLVDRTMYKIKPSDIEAVHWQTFDISMKNKVKEAVAKIKAAEEEINERNLRSELDMGQKEWSKFGKQIVNYTVEANSAQQRMLLLCGLPGSGKSTVAKILESKGWVRINQDEMGSRKACKKAAEAALVAGKSVVIDRCNFDVNQRKTWVDMATEVGLTAEVLYLGVSVEECIDRASKRETHPTLKDEDAVHRAIRAMSNNWVEPSKSEGFSNIYMADASLPAHEIVKEVENGE